MMSWRMIREHRFSRRHLPAMLDDELTDHQRRRIEAHADDCPECGPLLRDLLRFRRLLLGLGRAAGDEGARAEGILEYLHSVPKLDSQRPGGAW